MSHANDFETHANHRVRWTLWVAVLGLFGLIIWAGITEIDQVKRAQGQVIAVDRTQVIQAVDGGVLRELFVQEGQEVKAGQLLASFEKTRVKAALDDTQGKVMALRITLINAATVSSAITGLLFLGPLGALVFAGAAWNVGKKENEAGEALRGVGKAVLEAYNFLTTLNDKYKLTDKAASAIDTAVSSSENETVGQVKQTINEVTSKIGELNKEYDLLSKGKEFAKTAVTVTDAALDKVVELNAQYDFVETSKKLAGTAVEKIKEQTDKK